MKPDHILLAHGGGGRWMRDLIQEIILPAFSNPILDCLHDGAVLEMEGTRLAFTTDSYVIHPLFFPGGDIGKLSLCGTLNDLAMCGAKPLYLSAGFILEEGLPLETLKRILSSMKETAYSAGVQIVTGDTKVVEKGKGDQIFIHTTGIGILEQGLQIGPQKVQAEDAIVVSGDLGRHGITVLALREGISLETDLESDCADLSGLVQKLLQNHIYPHCMRDLTRGGLTAALVEIAEACQLTLEIWEQEIPLSPAVHGACEILGLDPLSVANEGRFVMMLPREEAEKALNLLQKSPLGKESRIIGTVKKDPSWKGKVIQVTGIGSRRILDLPSGEQLPRIC